MPSGQLFINDIDVYSEYGISMDTSALSTLMTPASKKDWISNEVRDEHGTRYLQGSYIPKDEKKEITIVFQLTAPNETTFFARYIAFCSDILEKGVLNIRTSFQPNTLYRCLYESCTQFTQFRRQMAFFSLKLIEPNPQNRTITETE